MKTLIIFFLFINIQISHGQKLSKSTQKKLRQKLELMSIDDQKYRWELMLGELDKHKLDSLKNLTKPEFWTRVNKVQLHEVGLNKSTYDSLWTLQNALDSINIEKFTKIIFDYGYPSFERTNSLFASVISIHLIGENKFTKFLTIFRDELKKGNMPPSDYAEWYDRNQLDQNKKQLYGAYDIMHPCVENLEITNIERVKIGLSPIKENNCK
jgi:hypothetical protein